MELKEERPAAELRNLNAETAKLVAETDKLEAEAWQIQFSVPMDAVKLGLAVFAAGIAGLKLAESLGWL